MVKDPPEIHKLVSRVADIFAEVEADGHRVKYGAPI